MKKLDEIMELMSDEMADFEINLHHLQQLNKELESQSIPISTAAIDENLQSFLVKQEKANEQKNKLIRDINIRLEKASLIPNYILVLFGSILILLLSVVGYFIYSANTASKENFEFYGISELNLENYHFYFAENPKLKEDYCNWLKKINN